MPEPDEIRGTGQHSPQQNQEMRVLRKELQGKEQYREAVVLKL